MINVRNKTQAEIEGKQAEYMFYANLAKGYPLPVCKTYLIKNDGTRVDTCDLTEEEILGLIRNDLIDYNSPQGSYKTTERTLDSFKLVEVLRKGGYMPSVNAVLQMIQMKQQFGGIVMDIMGAFGTAYYHDAGVIARFQKETNGDYSDVQTSDIVAVLEQISVNEKNKKSSKGRLK